MSRKPTSILHAETKAESPGRLLTPVEIEQLRTESRQASVEIAALILQRKNAIDPIKNATETLGGSGSS